MAVKAKTVQAAVGFRVKSGWATAVLLGGTADSPYAIDRRTITMSDPAEPDSTQPYHAVLDMPDAEAIKVSGQLIKIVRRAAARSVNDLLSDYRRYSRNVAVAGLVVGSVTDPSSIKNDHIRAHALEGRLFRTALEDAIESRGLRSIVLLERTVYSKAANILGRSEAELKRAVTELGKGINGSWRADEKNAALAAWICLANGK